MKLYPVPKNIRQIQHFLAKQEIKFSSLTEDSLTATSIEQLFRSFRLYCASFLNIYDDICTNLHFSEHFKAVKKKKKSD